MIHCGSKVRYFFLRIWRILFIPEGGRKYAHTNSYNSAMTIIAQDDHVTAGAWAVYEPFKTIHASKIRRNVVEVSFRSRIRRKARNFVEFRRISSTGVCITFTQYCTMYHPSWPRDMNLKWRQRWTSVWQNHHHEKPSNSRSLAAKMNKNTKDNGEWILTPPDIRFFYGKISNRDTLMFCSITLLLCVIMQVLK